MSVKRLKPHIFAVGALDWDRRLFDELIPLPEGTSYNAYVVQGREKTALIETVDPAKVGELFGHLSAAGVDRIDYVVANHAEQDHSGSIPDILEMFPEARVVTNEKCRNFLIDLLLIPEERFLTVSDGATLELGGATLEFLLTPWVHWPETMLTYLREEKILFSCDLFGSHLAQSELFLTDRPRTYEAAKRYFAEIMMPFRPSIVKYLQRLKGYAVEMIAPSHGVVYDQPSFILDAYREWTGDGVKNKVLVPFVSMHGSTRRMVEYFCESLMARNIPVIPLNLTHTDIGELAKDLVDAATVVIGSPMVLTGAHPTVVGAVYLFNALRPKTRFLSIIGSFGWGGRMLEQLQGMVTTIKPEVLPPVFIKGFPREADFQALDKLAETIAAKHREAGIV